MGKNGILFFETAQCKFENWPVTVEPCRGALSIDLQAVYTYCVWSATGVGFQHIASSWLAAMTLAPVGHTHRTAVADRFTAAAATLGRCVSMVCPTDLTESTPVSYSCHSPERAKNDSEIAEACLASGLSVAFVCTELSPTFSIAGLFLVPVLERRFLLAGRRCGCT